MQDYLQEKPTVCATCGQVFDASKRNRGKGIHRYCGPKCRQKADNARHYRRRNPVKTEAELTRHCVICGISFVTDAAHPNALTCSVKCNQARMDSVRRQKRAKNTDLFARACEECGELYTPHPLAAHKQRFCSKKCQNRVMQRRHKRTPESHRRLGTAKWQVAAKAALARDNHKCRVCGESEKRLNAHHLFHRTDAEMHDHSLDGLITLCGKCHNKVHDIRIGRQDGEIVISGIVFGLLGITEIRIEK